MGKKDDRDNRANQLNPNNAAYYSSRDHELSEDDDFGPTSTRHYSVHSRVAAPRFSPEPEKPMEAIEASIELNLEAVDSEGRYFEASLLASSHSEALNAVRVAWEELLFWSVRLSDRRVVFFENRREPRVSSSDAKMLVELSHLQSVVAAKKLQRDEAEQQYVQQLGPRVDYRTNVFLQRLSQAELELQTLRSLVTTREVSLRLGGFDATNLAAEELRQEARVTQAVWSGLASMDACVRGEIDALRRGSFRRRNPLRAHSLAGSLGGAA